MKKEYRVKSHKDFSQLFKKRQSVANRTYVIYYLKREEHLRIGLSVSKKLGKAVVRNKIKRQVRMMTQEFDFEYPYDIVIIVRKPYLNQDYDKNKKELLNVYHKLKQRMEK